MSLLVFGFLLSHKRSLSTLLIFSPLSKFIPKFKSFCCFGREATSQDVSVAAERFVSLLETCPDIKSLRSIHARIFTWGLGNSIFLGSKLLNCYASVGMLTDSKWVFGKIINENLSLWTSVIIGYFKTGHFSEVLHRYLDLKRRRIGMDSSALTFTLKSCIELGVVEAGRQIHVDALKFELNSDRFVGSSLIGLYSKCGFVDDARKAFEEISERDVVAYTAMISAYSQLTDQHALEAFRIACNMEKEHLNPNRVTLISLLQAAAQLESFERGKSVHCYAIRRGIDLCDEIFETSLVDMYIKCGTLDIAASIFSRTKWKNTALWNVIIGGLVQTGQSSEALDLFCEMKEVGVAPDSITLTNVLLGCAELNNLHQGMSVHGYIIRMHINLDVVFITALISMYSNCDKIGKAGELFNRMKSRDVITFNVMILGYCRSGLAHRAIETFIEMVEVGVRPNSATMLSILSTCSDLMDIRKGRWIHGYILRHGFQTVVEVANQIIHMYAKCGHIKNAREVFERIMDKDLVSWTSMMMGYVHHGRADEALELFQLMQKAREEPDSVTILSLLQAFSQLGCLNQAMEVHRYVYRCQLERDVPVINSLVTAYAKCGRLDVAKVLFDNMVERDITSWNTMIAANGMHGNCIEALDLFQRMQEHKVEPDEVTFTSILSACSHAGLVEEGQRVFHSMTTEHFITPCEEHYGCMVDLLGRAGRLNEAYDFVKHLPSSERGSALSSLLSACRVHRNTELAEVIGRQLLDVEPESSGAYALVSNLYAEAGKWGDVARVRSFAKETGLRKMPGYSLMESAKEVCEM